MASYQPGSSDCNGSFENSDEQITTETTIQPLTDDELVDRAIKLFLARGARYNKRVRSGTHVATKVIK